MSRDFHHTLASFYGCPWAILPSKLDEIHAVLMRRIGRGADAHTVPPEFAAARGSSSGGNDKPFDQVGSVAVVGIRGTIMPRASLMSEYSGGVSAEGIGRAVDAAAADKTVSSILLDIDSPGGAVYGIVEAADKIAEARAQKRVVAMANPVAASAAYWLAAQASEIVVTPSGQVGSIGVIAIHADTSKADEMAGERYTIIAAGANKAERAPYAPLSTGALLAWQEDADQYYRMFLDAVAKGRGIGAKTVEDNFGQGRMRLAADAVRLGMADRIGTLQSTLQAMVSAAPVRNPGESERRQRAMAVAFAEKGLPTS